MKIQPRRTTIQFLAPILAAHECPILIMDDAEMALQIRHSADDAKAGEQRQLLHAVTRCINTSLAHLYGDFAGGSLFMLPWSEGWTIGGGYSWRWLRTMYLYALLSKKGTFTCCLIHLHESQEGLAAREHEVSDITKTRHIVLCRQTASDSEQGVCCFGTTK